MNSQRASELPVTWRAERLGDLATVVYGESLRTEARLGRGGVPVYGSGGIVGEHDAPLHKGPSIVIGRKGSVGALYMVQEPFWAIDTTFYLREVSPEIEVEFLYHALWTKNLARLAIMVGVPGLNRQDLEKQLVPLPTPSEQRHIVDILRQADKLRQLRREANKLVEDLLPSLFQEMFGDLTQSLPDKFIALDKVADVVSGVAKGRALRSRQTVTVPYLRVANVQDGYLDLSEIKTIEATPSEVELYRLKPGDVLLTEGGDFDKLGRGAIWEHDVPDCIHQNHIFRVRLDHAQVRPRFFDQFLQTPFAKVYFLRAGKRTTNIASINLTQLKALLVPIVAPEQQDEFIRRSSGIRALAASCEQSDRKIGELFASLISRAFTGELTTVWRSGRIDQLTQEAVERDRRLGAHPKRFLTREDILRTPDSRDLLAAETTLAKALNGVAQQIAVSTKLQSSTLQTLAQSPVMAMAQQIQRQYAEVFDSLTLRAVRQIANDQQRILAAMAEPLRQMTAQVSKRMMEDLLPAQTILSQFAEMAKLALAEPDPSHPRYHLLRSLSREQHDLYLALQTAEGYVRPEAMAEESGLPLGTVQRDLDLLVTIGLAQQVNVATKPSDKLIYVPACRRVRPSDNARLAMMERLMLQESAP